jgi:hypothetical protein
MSAELDLRDALYHLTAGILRELPRDSATRIYALRLREQLQLHGDPLEHRLPVVCPLEDYA